MPHARPYANRRGQTAQCRNADSAGQSSVSGMGF